MNLYGFTYAHLSIWLWEWNLESSAYFELQFILVILKLVKYNFVVGL